MFWSTSNLPAAAVAAILGSDKQLATTTGSIAASLVPPTPAQGSPIDVYDWACPEYKSLMLGALTDSERTPLNLMSSLITQLIPNLVASTVPAVE